jgi:hypothetical protein
MKEKFKQIFEGLKIAYGQYQKGERGENGKQGGKAFIVRETLLTIYGIIILKVKDLLLGLYQLPKIILVVGGALILMNIILIILYLLLTLGN